MTHLTATGYYAGQTFCGSPRNTSDDYIHGFQPGMRPEALAKSGRDMCSECMKVYNKVNEEEA